jgi:aminoglycoside phosphotransferase (APT) family kinase protein
VHDGELAAVVDFGDLCGGDPATDLAVAWMLFDPDAREAFFEAYSRADPDTRERAKGWALALSLVYLSTSADNPLMRGIGERTLHAVLQED